MSATRRVRREVGEYRTFVQDNPDEAIAAYRDTVGDLVGSLCGSSIAPPWWPCRCGG